MEATPVARKLSAWLAGRFEVGQLIRLRSRSAVFHGRGIDGLSVIIKASEAASAAHMQGFRLFSQRVHNQLEICNPHLVRTLDIGTVGDTQLNYAIMERIDGPTLGEFLLRYQSELTIGGVLDLLFGVANGIDSLHRAQIVHRDIKPDNIFVAMPQRMAKIGDFEIALGIEDIAQSGVLDASGTPAYIAPEQIIGTNYGPPADIYAFAMTIYVLLTRTFAYDTANARELLYAQVNRRPVPLCLRNRSWPVALQDVLARSMSKEPEERHPTATALISDVAHTLRSFTPFRLSSYFDGSLSQFSSGEVPINF